MNSIELKALQRSRLAFLEDLDVDHVKDHLIQYEVSRNVQCLSEPNHKPAFPIFSPTFLTLFGF